MSPLPGEIMNERSLEPSALADLLVGPLLRYVGTDMATIWVETTKPCVVSVLGHRTRTMSRGITTRYYVVEGLERGVATPYELTLDEVVVWPRADGRPTRLRTSRNTRISIANRGRTSTFAGCSRRCRRR
jgi:hypothetical protein